MNELCESTKQQVDHCPGVIWQQKKQGKIMKLSVMYTGYIYQFCKKTNCISTDCATYTQAYTVGVVYVTPH